eukprot:SAG31_NODE_139_length_22847_cov_8.142474_5_plen_106_part_00
MRLLRSLLLSTFDDLVEDTDGSSVLEIYKDKGRALLESMTDAIAIIDNELQLLAQAEWTTDTGAAELQFESGSMPRILGDESTLTLRLVLKPPKPGTSSQKKRAG